MKLGDARWFHLMKNESAELTAAEIEKGWHFCAEWDGLLIGPGMAEYEHYCPCEKPVSRE